MARVTTISLEVGVVYFPKDPAAVRAVVRNLAAQSVHLRDIAQDALRDRRFNLDIFRDALVFARRLVNKLFKQRTHLANLDHMIDFKMIEGALRHLRIGGILRLLDHSDSPTFLDRNKTGSSVVEHACQHHADDAWAMRDCRGAE